MSGSIEQQISHTAKPEGNSLVDSVSNWFSQAANSVDTTVHNVETSASNLAASVHLPGLQLIDSGPRSAAPAKEAAGQAQASHPSLLTEAENLGNSALNAVEHHPLQAAEAVVAGAAAAVAPGAIPAIVEGVAAADPKLASQVGNVATQLGKGALDEVEHHPLKVAESAAIGLGVGLAVGGATVLAVGTGVIAAPVAAAIGVAATVGAVGYGAYQAYEHRDAIIHDTLAVANPQSYSANDVAQARQSVQNFGGAALEKGVGVIASLPGVMLGGAAVADAVGGATASADGAAVSTTGVRALADSPVPAPAAVADSPVLAPAAVADSAGAGDANAALTSAEGAPFTADQTTMTVTNQAAWDKMVAANGQGYFGKGILTFANGWATQMEQQMAAGQPMSKEMVYAAMNAPGTPDASGSMIEIAKGALYQTWKYGPQLEKIDP